MVTFHLSKREAELFSKRQRGKRCWKCGEEEEMCHLPGGQVGDRKEEEEAWVVSGISLRRRHRWALEALGSS